MSVQKNGKNGWLVKYRKFNSKTGKNMPTTKRTFSTAKEAREWEADMKLRKNNALAMCFKDFAQLYLESECSDLKDTTLAQKKYIIKEKLVPFFGTMRVDEIGVNDIRRWNNELVNDGEKKYTKVYLRTLRSQLSAIFNFGVRAHNLKANPVNMARLSGGKASKKHEIWTPDEYSQFAAVVKSVPLAYYIFEFMFWLGARVGETLAVQKRDIDFARNIVHIVRRTATEQAEPDVDDPKTEAGTRDIQMPESFAIDLQAYIAMLPDLEEDDYIFFLSPSTLRRLVTKYSKIAGIHRIRLHDFRHSNATMLAEAGYTPQEIAARLGWSDPSMAYQYCHVTCTKQHKMADSLDSQRVSILDDAK